MDQRSKDLRKLIIQGLEGGGRGHVGSSLSLVEILRVFYDSFLNIDPQNSRASERDRFILSKGHGCLALYAILADKGFFEKSLLNDFCRSSGLLGGHPERFKVPGVEASTGALGHGLSMGVGVALAARMKRQTYRVVVVCGDGEINEGSVWEAAMSASKHKLSNLTVVVDYNKLQSYGFTREVLDLEPLVDKWQAFGFETREVDGHDVGCLQELVKKLPFDLNKPSAIIAHTVKGKGITFVEGKADWHHKSSFKPGDIQAMIECLDA